MIDINELKTMLKDMNLVRVSKAAGLNYGKVYRMVHTDAKPSYDTVQKLVKYIDSITPAKAA